MSRIAYVTPDTAACSADASFDFMKRRRRSAAASQPKLSRADVQQHRDVRRLAQPISWQAGSVEHAAADTPAAAEPSLEINIEDFEQQLGMVHHIRVPYSLSYSVTVRVTSSVVFEL